MTEIEYFDFDTVLKHSNEGKIEEIYGDEDFEHQVSFEVIPENLYDQINNDKVYKDQLFYMRSRKLNSTDNVKDHTLEDYPYDDNQQQWINGTFQLYKYLKLEILKDSLDCVKPSTLNILEVGSGTGFNSTLIERLIRDHIPNKTINNFIRTDLFTQYRVIIDSKYDSKYNDKSATKIECGLASEVAVQKYGQDSNVLLLISPPSNSHLDYYAITEYEKIASLNDETTASDDKEILDNTSKYIIYIGEMGGIDGCTGMYKYMTTHKHWKLVYRHIICAKLEVYLPHTCKHRYITELFIFEYTS
jgi:hypothetical protein